MNGCGAGFKVNVTAAWHRTMLTSSLNPSTYGQRVTFSALVTSSLGAPPDGETVTFMKGATILGTGTLRGGSASFTAATLSEGANAITAGDGGHAKIGHHTADKLTQVGTKAQT